MEKNQDANHCVTINIPKTKINSIIIKKLVQIGKKINVNGFRKGRVPINIIQEKYGSTIYYDVFQKLMQKFFYKFTKKQNIKIIGNPKYRINKKQNDNTDFTYSVFYEIYPNFSMKSLKDINVVQIITKITHNDIQNIITKKQEKTKNWIQVNRLIKNNDRVTINYNLYEKYKKIEQFESKNFTFIVSKNIFLPQLEQIVINRFVNDIVFFKINFHQFHPETTLKNKDITFKIKIIKVEKEQDNNVENFLKDNITQSCYENETNILEKHVKKITTQHLKNQIIQKIIQNNPILIPPVLLQEEIQDLYNKKKEQYHKNQHNVLEKKYHENILLKAKNRLHIQIILENIITKNNLHPDENIIQSLIKKISLNYKIPSKIINLYNKNEILRNTIKDLALEIQVMHFLKKNINIKKQYWNFDKFINHNWKNEERLFI
jgi:trigger factor